MAEKDFFVHESSYVDEGCVIGKGTRIWHFTHVMPGCTIGESCNIGQNVVISPGVTLGNNVKIQNNVSVYTGVHCEDDVFLGPSMVFTNVTNPRSAVNRRGAYKTTMVRKGATIGANATIVCGNEIGAFAFIGAGAVVTKNVPDFALVVGNPARQTGWMSRYGHKLTFDADGIAVCPESQEHYKLENGLVTIITKS
ncbi:MAG: acyltransferase [Bacteroidia bacterium]|jgi:UDP-2-acetamido-3-amino-2,3-dideoxy-glucuronate N-acetyltransferase